MTRDKVVEKMFNAYEAAPTGMAMNAALDAAMPYLQEHHYREALADTVHGAVGQWEGVDVTEEQREKIEEFMRYRLARLLAPPDPAVAAMCSMALQDGKYLSTAEARELLAVADAARGGK
jgi:hypothetical protein